MSTHGARSKRLRGHGRTSPARTGDSQQISRTRADGAGRDLQGIPDGPSSNRGILRGAAAGYRGIWISRRTDRRAAA